MLGNKRTLIRANYEKRGGAEGGEGEIRGAKVKGAVSIITCNLAASATHHLVSVVPWI